MKEKFIYHFIVNTYIMPLESNQLRIHGDLVSFAKPKKPKKIRSGILTFLDNYSFQGNMLIPNTQQPHKQIKGTYNYKTEENEFMPELYFFELSDNLSKILVASLRGTPNPEKSLNKDYKGLYKLINPSKELKNELTQNPKGLNRLINELLNQKNNPTGIITFQAYINRRMTYK